MRYGPRSGASRALFGLVLWALGGCTFNVDIRPAEPAKLDAGEPKPDAGKTHDAGTVHDSGADAGEEDAGIVLVGVRHASCKKAFPAHIPGLPELRTDATGRPTFDLWRDLGCATLDFACHDDGQGISCGLCGDHDDEPRCYAAGSEPKCARDQTAMGYGDGKCAACTSHVEKARACCKHTKSVDCRAWPFARDSGPHQLCARHEDCQPGLVCKGGEARGTYGLCLCPETAIEQAAEEDACKQAFP
jgi:hypothetical protein